MLRKFYLLMIALILFGFTTQAQITLGLSDFASPGLMFTVYEGGSGGPLNLQDSTSLGSAGANGVYDFAKIEAFYYDTSAVNFISPNNLPMATPGATVARIGDFEVDSLGDTILIQYGFYEATASSFHEIGYTFVIDTAGLFNGNPSGILDTVSATVSPYKILANSSFALPYSTVDTSWWSVGIGSFTHFEQSIKSIQIDGWGELTTPNGTFSVLRNLVTEYRTSIDSMGGMQGDIEGDTLHAIEFWTEQAGWPVLTVGHDGNLSNYWGFEFINATPVAIEENLQYSFEFFPNPASSRIGLKFDQGIQADMELVIYNGLGQIVERNRVRAGITELSLDVERFNPGVYYGAIRDLEGNNLFVRKWIKE